MGMGIRPAGVATGWVGDKVCGDGVGMGTSLLERGGDGDEQAGSVQISTSEV